MSVLPERGYSVLERTPSKPPVIAEVPSGVVRPLWSVMIPVYNCLNYLRATLESVLVQDPGSELMQITVVDDCSTDGDVGALVLEVGKGRVEYLRQEQNVGSLRNFETCLNRSIGHWVHILHGDDRVMPGFYAEVQSLFEQNPEAGAAFTNTAYTMGEESALFVHATLAKKPGILKDFLIQNAQKLQLQPPAIVVKRSVYEQLGGFYAVHYGEDWEMWTRIGAHFPVAYSPKCLANYRYITQNSISESSILTGQNVQDMIKVFDIIQTYLPAEHRERVTRIARRDFALYCISLAHSLYLTDRPSAMVQAKGALQMSNDLKVHAALAKFLVKDFLRYREAGAWKEIYS